MKKPTIRMLIKAKAAALKSSPPKSRDRVRHELRVLEIAMRIKRESKAA